MQSIFSKKNLSVRKHRPLSFAFIGAIRFVFNLFQHGVLVTHGPLELFELSGETRDVFDGPSAVDFHA